MNILKQEAGNIRFAFLGDHPGCMEIKSREASVQLSIVQVRDAEAGTGALAVGMEKSRRSQDM